MMFFSLLYIFTLRHEHTVIRGAWCFLRSWVTSPMPRDASTWQVGKRDDILRHDFSSRMSWFVFSLPAKRIVGLSCSDMFICSGHGNETSQSWQKWNDNELCNSFLEVNGIHILSACPFQQNIHDVFRPTVPEMQIGRRCISKKEMTLLELWFVEWFNYISS